MACADVATAKAKTIATSLIMAFLPCEPSRRDFPEE
jgi:hypothetical protein